MLEKNGTLPCIVNIVKDLHVFSWDKNTVDVSGIFKTTYSFEQLNEIKQGYKNNIDLTVPDRDSHDACEMFLQLGTPLTKKK